MSHSQCLKECRPPPVFHTGFPWSERTEMSSNRRLRLFNKNADLKFLADVRLERRQSVLAFKSRLTVITEVSVSLRGGGVE